MTERRPPRPPPRAAPAGAPPLGLERFRGFRSVFPPPGLACAGGTWYRTRCWTGGVVAASFHWAGSRVMNRTGAAMSEGKTGPRARAARAMSETSGRPAITVGVPCYNVAPYLERCLGSLLDQTFEDFEIVVVNDGSTDDTALILDEFARTSGRMRVLHQDNRGLGPARNRVLEAARGEYVTFVDGDDWLAPHCLEAAHDRAARDDLDILCFGWVLVDHDGARAVGKRHDHLKFRFDRPDELRRHAFTGLLNLMSCASLVRTALFHDHGLRYPPCWHEDLYVTPFLHLYAQRHGYLDDGLYFWRKRSESITQRAVGKDHIDGMIGAFHSWKGRLWAEGRFDDFRASFVVGVFAYMLQLLRRIEASDVDRGALVAHLRDEAAAFPELRTYKHYLSHGELRHYAKVIETMVDNRRDAAAPKTTKRAPSPVKETGGLKDLLRWPVRPFARTWLTSPTVAVLALGLGLTFAGLSGLASSMWLDMGLDMGLDMWLTGAGLALVGLVIVKEGLLWRWMDRRLLSEERERAAKALADERDRAGQALAEERARLDRALDQGLAAERARAGRELTKTLAEERARAAKALADERARAEQELTKALGQALSEERARADRALTESLAAEREHAAKALADERSRTAQELTKTLAQALSEERARAEQELTKALGQALSEERARADRALTESLAAEREHAAKALADERARAAQELTESLAAEREHAAKALADEHARAEQELAKTLAQALAEERARADRELKKAVAAEREHAAKALAEERDRAGQELTKTLAQALSEERARADRALTEGLATERGRARRELTKALAAERRAAGRASTEAPGQPAITVGVPCYNVAPYLERCIRSLLEQTFDDFEIVAVDDGSTDDTGSLLDELARESVRMRVLHQDNRGLGPARNRILEQARGEYVTFVDADDWLAPHCLETVHDRAVRDDLDILCFGFVRVDSDSGREIARRQDYKGLRFDRPGEIRQHAFAGRINLMSCASLVRAALFHDHGLRYPACLHEDLYVTPFLHLYAERHGYLDGELYFWLERPDSITRRAVGRDHIDGMIGAFHEWETRLSREGRLDDFRDAVVAALFRYISHLLRRIEASDVDRAALAAYLRDEAAAFPELRAYKHYLSPEEIQDYAKAIEIIDNGHDAAAEMGNGLDTAPAAEQGLTRTSGQPAITVGVACYNAAPYLERCIGSLLEQTFDNFEIVAVDDGSTDRTGSILDEFARTSAKVRVFHQEDNEGPGPARNLILEQARGEYITFVDADDWLAPHCLEAVHDRALRDDLDILCFGFVRVDHTSGRVIERRSDYKGLRFDRPGEIRRHAFAGRLKLMTCASLVRAALFHDHGLRYPACLHEDMYVTPFLHLYAERHGYLDGELYFWRRRLESISQRALGKDHIDGTIGAFHSWKGRLSSEGRFDDFRASFVSGLFLYMFHLLRRIERSDIDREALVAYLRDEARAFPELRAYKHYLSPEEIQDYAKAIEIIDNGHDAAAETGNGLDTAPAALPHRSDLPVRKKRRARRSA